MIDRDQFKALAGQLRDLQDANKSSITEFMERAEAAGVDPAGLRRFVSWKRQDEEKRAQKEAIDQQCRYLAGERDTPAELPIGCELAQALNCYRRNLTVRQVAEELNVSTGKAGKLRDLARMFDVHVHARVDKRRSKVKPDIITPEAAATLPAGVPSKAAATELVKDIARAMGGETVTIVDADTGEITQHEIIAEKGPPEQQSSSEQAAPHADNASRSPVSGSSAVPRAGRADVPTGNEGNAGEREPFHELVREPDPEAIAAIPDDDGEQDQSADLNLSPIVQALIDDAARARELAARPVDDLQPPTFLKRTRDGAATEPA